MRLSLICEAASVTTGSAAFSAEPVFLICYLVAWRVDTLRTLEITLAIFGVVAAVGGVFAFGFRSVRQLVRAWSAVGVLHAELGDEPITRLLEILRDIEASHGELEIRQRLAERHLEIGVYVCDKHGKCTWANDWLCESLGIDSSRIKDYGWISAIATSEQVRVHEHWQKCVASGLPYEETYQVEPSNPDLPRWTARAGAWPVSNRAGDIVCYVGYIVKGPRSSVPMAHIAPE